MSLHHTRPVARIYCGLALIVTMVMNITIYDSYYKRKRFNKIVSTALYYIVLIESLQTISGHERFQLQLIFQLIFAANFSVSLRTLLNVKSLFITISPSSRLFNFSGRPPD